MTTSHPISRLLFPLFLLALLSASQAQAAQTTLGPCEWIEGKCVRPLGQVLTPEEHEQLMRRPAVVEPELELVNFDLRTGRETTIRIPEERDLRSEVNTNAAKAGRKSLTRMDTPWTHNVLKSAVKLVMSFGSAAGASCSGTLVGRHTVVTAGHCVYSHASEELNYTGYATSIMVYPEFTNGYGPMGGVAAVAMVTTNSWRSNQDFRGDLGMVQLETNIGDVTGYQAIGTNAHTSGTFSYAGYPGASPYDGSWLYMGSTSVGELDSYNLCHYNDLIQGQSGGPGWFAADNPLAIIAVNSYSTGGWGYTKNCSCRVSSAWVTQASTYESQNAATPTNYWTCDLSRFHEGSKCDCACGLWDPDCYNTNLGVRGCDAGLSCSFPGECKCVPNCTGRYCGEDGCGGSCGTCSAASPICDAARGKCLDCDEATPCSETGFSCQSGECKLDCVLACKDVECGFSLGCRCATCADGMVCRANKCETAVEDGDQDTDPIIDGDKDSDTDTTPLGCSGACDPLEPAVCADEATICQCVNFVWTPESCESWCRKRNFYSTGCGHNAVQDRDICVCSSAPVDGDTTDAVDTADRTDLDYDRTSGLTGTGGDGCASTRPPLFLLMSGLLVGLALRRRV